ncbi:MAG: NAD(P)/FAD-dependent oxidoreductase [Chloroflexi bacterium]|nr:NAD(P)/FAD-dependent oxidoreductase [Chloroflexota bacterium]
MTAKRIAVLGGGFGGVAAARTARALLSREHQVTLIDRKKRTYLCGAFPLLIVGERELLKSSRSLGLLANRGIRYLQDEVQSIDTASMTLETSQGKLEYDYLVLAPGAVDDWDAVPGAEAAYSFYDMESARRLRRRLRTFRKGRIVIGVARMPYKCPPAPFETAMVLSWFFKGRGQQDEIEIHVSTPEPMPLAVAGPEAAARLVRDMERRGIEVHTNAGVKEVSPSGQEVAFTDGTSLDADLAITIPVHRPPQTVAAAGLVGSSGWVEVDRRTLQTGVPGVYAVGDVNMVPMANGRGLPKAGVFASAEGEVVGANIAAAINGTDPVAFSGVGHCFIAYGGDRVGMVAGDFMAEGKPRVELTPATARGMRAKERFERDWRRFRI